MPIAEFVLNFFCDLINKKCVIRINKINRLKKNYLKITFRLEKKFW